MSYFDTLLQRHELARPPQFLWMLKLRVDEYEELKRVLRNSPVYLGFKGLERECTLYFAEWWRREYAGGYAKIQEVCESVFDNDIEQDAFYAAAIAGAKRLSVQIVKTQGPEREKDNTKYSIFFQGGLPMNFIVKEILKSGESSNWDRFFRSLVWDEQDYSQIPGKVASRTASIHEFCATLRSAENISEAPFSPSGCKKWWDIIVRDFEIEKKAHNARNPFRFKWLLQINENRKTIESSFNISGPQDLSPEFIKGHHLEGVAFISLSVLINGSPYHLAEYNENNGKFYSRRSVDKNFRYRPGDDVEIIINENGLSGEVIDQHCLDFSDPKICILDDPRRNIFSLCDEKKLATDKCCVISSSDWMCESIVPDVYNIGEESVKAFKTIPEIIPLMMTSPVSGDKKELNPNRPLTWTIIDEKQALSLAVPAKERLYNAPDGVIFYEGTSERNKKECSVVYSSKGSKNWSSTPQYGIIKARVKRIDNESVDAVSFVNVGNLEIKCYESSRDRCRIQVTWPHGHVECNSAQYLQENMWMISRMDLADARFAPFTFHPAKGKGEPFTVNFKVPFYGFQIYDFDGNEVANKAIIPTVDLDGFRYYLHLPGRLEIIPGTEDRADELKYRYTESEDKKGVRVSEILADLPPRERKIPFEGRLASLFLDGSEQVSSLLDKQNESLPDAKVTIRIRHDDVNQKYYFKDFPYRLEGENGDVIIMSHDGLPTYEMGLQAVPFINPEHTPIQLPRIDVERYAIPDEMKETGTGGWLIYGDTKGYILPWALFFDSNPDDDSRSSSRAEIIDSLKNDLKNSGMFSPAWKRALKWFEMIQEGTIPGTSILELVAIADDRDLLGKLAFHLYILNCKSEEDKARIKSACIDFQKQMSFLWLWAGDSGAREWLLSLGDDMMPALKSFYGKWVVDNKEEKEWVRYLTDPNHIPECYGAFEKDFKTWLEVLKTDGVPDKKYLHADVIQNGGDERLSPEAQEIFAWAKSLVPNAKALSADDVWKSERRMLSAMLCQMNIGDLGEKESVKREIRKSIIYGLKFKLADEV